ncbi:hypothetical protein NEOLEDRAFT_1081464, partial [Neolentinus lepideus HHB14362 ss-1]
DQRAGRVMRNIEGKVVLPSGIMVPQNLPGANMRERIMEWHRRNPSQVAANIIKQMIYEDVKMVGAPRDTFQLDVNERIESLEKELFALRKRSTFDGVQKTTAPAPGPSTPSKLHNLPPHMPNAPIHLYAQARDINRPRQPAPKTVCFDTSQEKVAEAEQARSKEPVYRAQAPVYDPVVSENVFRCSLSTPYVLLTSQELLAISPEVRNKYHNLVTPKRVPPTPEHVQATLEEVADEELTSPETFLCSDLLTYGKTEERGDTHRHTTKPAEMRPKV